MWSPRTERPTARLLSGPPRCHHAISLALIMALHFSHYIFTAHRRSHTSRRRCCTSASNLPIAIKETPSHLNCRVSAQGIFWHLGFCCFSTFFSSLRCVTFSHIRLRKKGNALCTAPAAGVLQPIPPCALHRPACALKRYPKQFRAGPCKSFPPNRLSQAANPLPLVVFL